MSRSFKKNPITKVDYGGRKYLKKQANRKIRHSLEVPDGKQYKKFFNSRDIYEYVIRCSSYKEIVGYPEDIPKAKRIWAKYYYRK